MTFGYWFWLATACAAGAAALFALTAKRGQRSRRTVHTITLFILLAFGGFKCAYDEGTRQRLLEGPGVFVMGITRDDGGGLRMNGTFVEGVEYSFGFGARGYSAFGLLSDAYTIERDFAPESLRGRCLLIKTLPQRPDISKIVAVMQRCVPSPENGWPTVPPTLYDDFDALWWRGMPIEEQ